MLEPRYSVDTLELSCRCGAGLRLLAEMLRLVEMLEPKNSLETLELSCRCRCGELILEVLARCSWEVDEECSPEGDSSCEADAETCMGLCAAEASWHVRTS
mmetsp:Transcript_66109/g.115061  ORF Transcript_66109/g.115061 Transcript_66109/m.115061 type:complete len:101 (-) Transcript_66109:723-1025(-)